MKFKEIGVKEFLAVFIVVYGMNALVFANVSDSLQDSIVNLILLIMGYYYVSSVGSAAKDKATNEALADIEKARKEREEIALIEAERVRLEREEADVKAAAEMEALKTKALTDMIDTNCAGKESDPVPGLEIIGGSQVPPKKDEK
jgi:hypothetical protein